MQKPSAKPSQWCSALLSTAHTGPYCLCYSKPAQTFPLSTTHTYIYRSPSKPHCSHISPIVIPSGTSSLSIFHNSIPIFFLTSAFFLHLPQERFHNSASYSAECRILPSEENNRIEDRGTTYDSQERSTSSLSTLSTGFTSPFRNGCSLCRISAFTCFSLEILARNSSVDNVAFREARLARRFFSSVLVSAIASRRVVMRVSSVARS